MNLYTIIDINITKHIELKIPHSADNNNNDECGTILLNLYSGYFIAKLSLLM